MKTKTLNLDATLTEAMNPNNENVGSRPDPGMKTLKNVAKRRVFGIVRRPVI
jgi:hypothetical protein